MTFVVKQGDNPLTTSARVTYEYDLSPEEYVGAIRVIDRLDGRWIEHGKELLGLCRKDLPESC